MAAKQSAPVLGAPGDYAGPDKWEVGLSWRWQKSHRHFVGTVEQVNRETEQSQVINKIHLAELTVTRNFTNRWSCTVGIPYLMATRSSPIRDENRVVIGRSITQARGIGDVTATVRRWMFDPGRHTHGNTGLGLGIKLPTGENNVQDARQRFSNGQIVTMVQTVDQSIQPGDGGFGVVADVQTYYRFAHDRLGVYFTGIYLFNPEGTSGTPTFRSDPGEEVMSIADQYLARAGFAVFPSKSWAFNVGWRMEGVPVHDVFGSSRGFRRPGYSVSIEPGASWTHGPHTVGLSVPIAKIRNRQTSVADEMNDDQGDAAFADYLILVGYLRRF